MNEQAVDFIARKYTRRSLAQSATFHQLSIVDKKTLYMDVYNLNYRELVIQYRGGGFSDEVDFPDFVEDLMKGVFNANLQVSLTQMESYRKLLKTASQSITKFISAIDDTASFGYLAENYPDEFGLSFSDEGNEEGSRKPQLTDISEKPVDLGDSRFKARIMDAKRQMAKNQRAALRETILMGINRLIVEKGNVRASVLFDIKATEQILKAEKAALQEVKSSNNIT